MLGLSDIVGQDRAVASLQRAISGARVPHALMFVGPAGVGRRTTAEALAARLLCERGTHCGQCPDCTMMAAGSHPDFHLVYKELAAFHPESEVRGRKQQQLGIDVVKHFLIAPAGRAPTRGRARAFVVREAELMSPEAQNALLKTLEEPPDGVMIVLICIRAEQMLPTTRSRCRPVRFGPLPREFVVDKLSAGGTERGEARFWAAFTDGSIGRSAAMADGGMYEIKRDLIDRVAVLPPEGDTALARHLVKITDELAKAAVDEAAKTDGGELAKTLATRRATGTMLALIAAAFSDAMLLATGADRPLVNADQPAAVKALAERLGPADLARVVEQFSRYERLLWRNVGSKIIWDNVVLTCASGR